MTGPRLGVPPTLARHILTGLGDQGARWLHELPALLADFSEQWGLTLGPPFELSFNYVAPARLRDGTEAVLKVGPWEEEQGREIEALRLYDGAGICRLLAADVPRRAMLLERLRPGTMLIDVAARDDDGATRIGADVMRRLRRPIETVPDSARFRPLAEWFDAFERHRTDYGGSGPFPAVVFERAQAIAQELLASTPRTVLLHGDFHHYNVLAAERAPWLAIDPKGMLGDPGYEVGPFLLNPRGPPKSTALFRRRLDILAEELQYDVERLRQWSVAHAVLSACWSAENHGDGWQNAIAMAETLIAL